MFTITHATIGTLPTSSADHLSTDLTHRDLTIEYKVDVEDIDTWRQLADLAGDYRRILYNTADWDIVDWSETDTQVTVTVESEFDPPFLGGTYYIESYRERPNETGNSIDIQLTLAIDGARDAEDPNSVLEETATGDDWELDLRRGTIATPYVRELEEQGNKVISFEALLTGAQAEVVAESLSRIEGTAVEEIPDGDNVIRDNTRPRANGLRLTRATNLPAEYLPALMDGPVMDWALETTDWYDYYELVLTFAPTSEPTLVAHTAVYELDEGGSTATVSSSSDFALRTPKSTTTDDIGAWFTFDEGSGSTTADSSGGV